MKTRLNVHLVRSRGPARCLGVAAHSGALPLNADALMTKADIARAIGERPRDLPPAAIKIGGVRLWKQSTVAAWWRGRS